MSACGRWLSCSLGNWHLIFGKKKNIENEHSPFAELGDRATAKGLRLRNDKQVRGRIGLDLASEEQRSCQIIGIVTVNQEQVRTLPVHVRER
jgi:hypothetical protein